MLSLSQFDFDFPNHLIAQAPLERGESKMLAVNINDNENSFSHDFTKNLFKYLSPGDGIVLNETKVIPARLFGRSESGGKIEILLLQQCGENPLRWEAMVKPGKHCGKNATLYFNKEFEGTISEVHFNSGTRIIDFPYSQSQFNKLLTKYGHTPIPPYIKRNDTIKDITQYQSVFAKEPGSVAAPTASFHLSLEQLAMMEELGIHIIKAVLHVGSGTFLPVRTENIEEHPMHGESFSFSVKASEKVNEIKRQGHNIWAVGTTAARILESVGTGNPQNLTNPEVGVTHKFIYPGYQWKVVDGLLTNFHWPKSTLFMLVCSLIGVERAHEAYQFAFKHEYKLFSYGDAMLIFNNTFMSK